VEAEGLIRTRDRTGRLPVLAFPGSLSPPVRPAVRRIATGQARPPPRSAAAWQDWDTHTLGPWRQQPEVAGGGFLFDTGAHMLNTVCDLAGEDVTEGSAWLGGGGPRGRTAGA